MTSRLTVDGYTFDNPPSDYRKIIQLSNTPQTVFNRFTADFYQSDSQDIQVQVQGELSLNESTDLQELQNLQDKAINGGEVKIDFDPFFSGTGVITDTPFRQSDQRGEYDFTFAINSIDTDPSGYPPHATPTTGNTFELGSYDFGFDPDSVQQEYERQTPSVDTLQGINRTVDNKGLIPRVTVAGRTDGRGGHLLWQKARNNALSYLTAEFQNGWSLITRLQVGNDPDTPDFLQGLLQYSVDFLIVKDPSGGIGQVSSFIDHDVRDSGTYTADSDAGDSTTDSVNFTADSGSTTLNGQTTTFPQTTVDVQVGGATNYVYVYDEDEDGNGTVQVNQSAFPSDAAPLYEVETDADGITNVIDRRESDTTGGADSVDSIDYKVDGGTGSLSGSYVQWDTTTVQLATSTTNYVFVEDDDGDGYGTVTVNQSAVPSDSLGLWKVTTDSDSITDEVDLRDSLVDDGDTSGSDLTFRDSFGINDGDFDFARIMALGTEQIADPVESGFPPALGLTSLIENVPDVKDVDLLPALGLTSLSETFTVADGGSALTGGQTLTKTTGWDTASDWDAATVAQGTIHEASGDRVAGDVQLGFPATNPNGDPEALYSFDEGSFPMSELTGKYADASAVNDPAPSTTQTWLGTSGVDLDGGNDAIELPSGLNPANSDYTIILVADIRSFTNDTNPRVWDNAPNDSDGVRIYLSDDGTMNIQNGSGGTFSGFSYNPSYTSGLDFICVRFDNSTGDLELFFNPGGTTATASGTGPSVGSQTAPFTIGRKANQFDYLDAFVQDFAIFHRKLSGSEIRQHYKAMDTAASPNGTLSTDIRNIGDTVDVSSLELTSTATLNGQSITVYVESDTNNDGTIDQTSDPISLDGNGGPYTVTGLTTDTAYFRLRVELSTGAVTDTPVVDNLTLEGSAGGGGDSDQNPQTTWRITPAQHDTAGNEYEGGGFVGTYEG